MRIHTDLLKPNDFHDACRAAEMRGVWVVREGRHGSKLRDGAYDVVIGGTASHRTQADRDAYAATWDEWGMWLNDLWRRDPELVVPRVYESRDHFRWATGARFDNLTAPEQHRRHKWGYTGEALTGAYHVSECACGAVTRRGDWARVSALV